MLRDRLEVDAEALREINDFLLDPDNSLVNDLMEIIERYGGVEEINKRASESRDLDSILERLERVNPSYVKDLEWLMRERDAGRFIELKRYCEGVLGEEFESIDFSKSPKVTLEISACNFFEWFIKEAERAIKRGDLMPARYITTRSMKELVEDGDLSALIAATQIIGASHVVTLDTRGTMPGPDGQPINVHLGGCEAITGYFGGVGVPNRYVLNWVEELLHYYTNYGVREVLNINFGTVLLGFILHRLGVDIKFKISVYLGHDNPYCCLWTIMMAKLFSRPDGATPLSGLNLSNSVDIYTIKLTAYIRDKLGFRDKIRIEHHITESYKGIVRQPYDRLEQLLKVADHIHNLSAKHEGAPPEVEEKREHPSNILEYFIPKDEILGKGLMGYLLQNYLDKHDAVNRTARALVKNGLGVIAAEKLHGKL